MAIGPARRGLILVALRLARLIGFERIAEPTEAINEAGRLYRRCPCRPAPGIFCAFTTPPTSHSLPPVDGLAVSASISSLPSPADLTVTTPPTFFHDPTKPASGFSILAEEDGAVAHELVDRKVLLVLRNALVEAGDPVSVTDEILLVLGERLAGRERPAASTRRRNWRRWPRRRQRGQDRRRSSFPRRFSPARNRTRACRIRPHRPRWPPGRRPAPTRSRPNAPELQLP